MDKNKQIVELLDKHFGVDENGQSWFPMEPYDEQDAIYLVCCSLDDSIEMSDSDNFINSKLDFEFAKGLFIDLLTVIDDGFFDEPVSSIIGMFNSIIPIQNSEDKDSYNQSVKELRDVLSKYVQYM